MKIQMQVSFLSSRDFDRFTLTHLSSNYRQVSKQAFLGNVTEWPLLTDLKGNWFHWKEALQVSEADWSG